MQTQYLKVLSSTWSKDFSFQKQEKEIDDFKTELNMLQSILVSLTERNDLEKAHILRRKIERMKSRLELTKVNL